MNVRERLAVNKQSAQNFGVERFYSHEINELDFGKDDQIKISNSFAALENLVDSKDINRAWEIIKNNIKSSAKSSLYLYDLKQRKPWFDEEYSCF